MKLISGGLIACALAFSFGCTNSSTNDASNPSSTTAATAGTTGATGGKQLTIAVIPKGETHEYWNAMHAGADAAGKEIGAKIIWKGPINEGDRESQVKIVEDFVSEKVDGIVLAPLDDNALRVPVKEANDSKIPVLITDSALNASDIVSLVATDNEKGGEIAGEALAKTLNGKGKVIMLRYEVGSASTDDREKGFLAAMAKNPGITMASDNQYGGTTVDSAQKAAENLIAQFKNPDGTLSVQGIFTPNESTALGMLRVLQADHLAGKVTFYGFDSAPPLIDGLKSKQIDGLVIQDPYKMGYLGVKMIADAIHGKTVEKRVDTGATLVTAANLTDEKIAKLVNPPKD